MKTKYIFLCAAFLTALAGCSLDYDPISTPSELTEGKLTDTTKAVLADRDAAVSQRKAIYELLRNRQEHMHLDYVLLGDCHADNAYVGTVGAEVVPYETNTIEMPATLIWRATGADILRISPRPTCSSMAWTSSSMKAR